MTITRLTNYLPSLPALELARAPLYLRFTITEAGKLDALDQVTDVPEPGETIIPAHWLRGGTLHIDRTVNGRRCGEWRRTAEYEPVDCPLSQKELASTRTWGEWCLQQVAKEKDPA